VLNLEPLDFSSLTGRPGHAILGAMLYHFFTQTLNWTTVAPVANATVAVAAEAAATGVPR
jgi:hypothetical protein